MGYQALLFCADEKLARVVSQVFTELEFNIEQVNEPFSAVKKLMAQHYDAIVVDCENEQNASLLFKSARNSTSNQNSLALALVEGQAGVAKAYRIGANLVLTKPLNVEQAKGTLRVARGLLRKNADATAAQAIPAVPASSMSPAATQAESINVKPAFATLVAETAKSATASQSVKPEVPEFETAIPAMAASADAHAPVLAVPEPKAGIAARKDAPANLEVAAHEISKTTAVPVTEERKPGVIFAAMQGAAAAPAPAKEIPAPAKSIVKKSELFESSSTKAQPAEVVAPPTFSAVGEPVSEGTGGAKKFLVIAAVAAIAFGLGYFGWTKFSGSKVQSTEPSIQNAAPAPMPATAPTPAMPGMAADETKTSAPAPTQPGAALAKPQSGKPQAGVNNPPVTKIAVSPEENAPEVVTKSFAPAPIRVKTQSSIAKAQKPADEGTPALPDPLGVGSSKDNVASLVSGPARLPAAPQTTLRISQGVSQGLLIKKVQPVYPLNAKAMRLEGAVDMEAIIDKEGRITNLKVLKGQAVLARAATDAVRQWRYKPYYLDGEPVEIQTQITVVFKLPN
jgi:TonB family protein